MTRPLPTSAAVTEASALRFGAGMMDPAVCARTGSSHAANVEARGYCPWCTRAPTVPHVGAK